MNFYNYLLSTYCEDPCRVLPNAFWKTAARLEELQTSFQVENDRVVHLEVGTENSLLTYWTLDRKPSPDFPPSYQRLDMLVLHQDYLPAFPVQHYPVQTPYFRLIHPGTENEIPLSIPTGFDIIEVNGRQECAQVAHFIGQCYQDIQPTPDAVLSWRSHPTFDPELWIWLVDRATGLPAGLGIAEIDTTVSEGSLEWIQLLPSYQGKGLGKTIVQELLSRLRKRVKFTTVAGEVNNITHPEALYRNCGFKGHDIWWVLSKA